MGGENKMEDFRYELQRWKSYFQFIDDEVFFIEKLLNSYIFEPTTPNLFERLEQFKQEFSKSKKKKQQLQKRILEQERHLGGILECDSKMDDKGYCKKHERLRNEVGQYFGDYQKIKAEVYDYAGLVLKRRKPVL